MDESKFLNDIDKLSNENVRIMFKNMLYYMTRHLNNEVNVYRDQILKYALKMKNTIEYHIIDKLMFNIFNAYAMTWETYRNLV